MSGPPHGESAIGYGQVLDERGGDPVAGQVAHATEFGDDPFRARHANRKRAAADPIRRLEHCQLVGGHAGLHQAEGGIEAGDATTDYGGIERIRRRGLKQLSAPDPGGRGGRGDEPAA